MITRVPRGSVLLRTLVMIGALCLVPASSAYGGTGAEERSCAGLNPADPPLTAAQLRQGAKRPGPGKAVIPVDSSGKPLDTPPNMEFAFGSDRKPLLRTKPYSVPAKRFRSLVRGVVIGDIADASTGRTLPVDGDQMTFKAVPISDTGNLVNVRVCYDPSRPEEARPGVYTGNAQVTAPGLEAGPVAFEITLRDPDTPRNAILFGLLALAAGAFVRIVGDRRAQNATGLIDNGVMIVTGVVAGLLAYWQLLDDNPGFDASLRSLWPLMGTIFAATIAGKSLSHFVKGAS